MANSGNKDEKNGLPAARPNLSTDPPEVQPEARDKAPQVEPDRATILENAWRFLQEDEVRNAPTDKQIAFLESKGLSRVEIQELLGVSRNSEASSSATEPAPVQKAQVRTLPSSDAIPPPAPPPTQRQGPSPPSSGPPIITYPEFLTKPPVPAPLITAPRLLTTLYLFSGLSALLYGTHTYLLRPMLANLTAARHDLASHSLTNLEKLILRLEGMVSEQPVYGSVTKEGVAYVPYKDRDGDEEGDESSDSDPTELFHRDIGVQTSSPLPQSPNLQATSSTTAAVAAPSESSALEEQLDTISHLKSHLSSLTSLSTAEQDTQHSLSTCLSILREYLDGMAFVSYPSYAGYGLAGKGEGPGAGGDDEIAKVKAQIRGVKGVLLSARSFPTAAGGGAQMPGGSSWTGPGGHGWGTVR